jgi:hypothetical protein
MAPSLCFFADMREEEIQEIIEVMAEYDLPSIISSGAGFVSHGNTSFIISSLWSRDKTGFRAVPALSV